MLVVVATYVGRIVVDSVKYAGRMWAPPEDLFDAVVLSRYLTRSSTIRSLSSCPRSPWPGW